MEQIREKLFELQDKKYQEFHSKLCPNVEDIIGVRIPSLRKLAKQIAKENPREYLEKTPKEYYEERMLQGFVIGYMKAELEENLYQLLIIGQFVIAVLQHINLQINIQKKCGTIFKNIFLLIKNLNYVLPLLC